MSWRRSSGPKADTRYSFTVNFQSHPELEPLAHYLWALSPAPKTRNQAILKILQAGFQAMLLQGGHDLEPATAAPPASALAPVPHEPPVSQSPAPPARRPSVTTAVPDPPVGPVPPQAVTSPLAAAVAAPPAIEPPTTLSPAASRFLTQFDD